MPNPQRGDVSATIDGKPCTLRLTLGALAELEAALDAPDLVALAERFESGALSAREAIAIIGAARRGAGEKITDEAVARSMPAGGVPGTIRLASDLLKQAFGA